jgi:hypothetical protein
VALVRLVGSRCAGVTAGAGTGSALLLDFGARRRRDIEVPNDRLTYEQRVFEYEMSLRINCAWRLDAIDRVLCGWPDFDLTSGAAPACLDLLTGAKVNGAKLLDAALDLNLTFESDVSLRVFCDVTSEDDGDNYSLLIPGGSHVVRANSVLMFEADKEQ